MYFIRGVRCKVKGVRRTAGQPSTLNLQPQTVLWWFFQGCSPLPIPNREVKPLMADGTAPRCGRVGSCHILLKAFRVNERLFYFNQVVNFTISFSDETNIFTNHRRIKCT